MWRVGSALFLLLGLAWLFQPLFFFILLVLQLAALVALAVQILQGEAPRSQKTQAGQHKEEKSECHENQTSSCPSSRLTSGIDEPDAPASSNIQTAMEKVLNCAYKQFVFGWCDAPEPMQEQPLYKALENKIFEAVEEIKEKTAHVNIAVIIVGVVNRLTRHLHECKKKQDKPRQKLFKTKEDEAAVYREYTEELLGYLLPASLTETQLTKRFLIEIFTLKVFKPTVDNLSDPDFLNQMLIQKFGQPETSQLTNEVDLPVRGNLQVAEEPLFTPQEEHAQANTENGDSGNPLSKFRKKGKKVLKGVKEMFPKLSKRKHNANGVEFRSLQTDGGDYGSTDADFSESDTDSLESDGYSSEESSDKEIDMNVSDLWSSLTKILWEEWNRGTWKATVSNLKVSDDGRFSCTIRVEDEECPEESYWEFERDSRIFISLKETLSQDFPDLVDINIQSLVERQDEKDNQFLETELNDFLERLVRIVKTSQNSEAFYFLFPVELSVEDDDHPSESEEVEPSEEFEADGLGCDAPHTPTFRSLEKRKATPPRKKSLPLRHDVHENSTEMPATQETSDETPKKALIKLFVEILNFPGSTLVTKHLLKWYLDHLPNKVIELCSESQLASYIDSLREEFWPNGEPAPPIAIRTCPEKKATRKKAEKLLLNICTIKILKLCCSVVARTSFNVFQQADQNKILIYQCLYFLLDEILLKKERTRDIDDILSLT